MATRINTGRQTPLIAKQNFDYTDTSVTVKVPYGAIVTGGFLVVDTAWDSATSAGATLGDAGVANRYLASTNIKATGLTALTRTGYKSDGADLTLAIANVGAPTTGAGYVVVEYIIDGRATEVQTN